MKRVYLLLMMILGVNSFISAQVTTASISGKIIDLQNAAVIGATVKAVHEPSGTFYGAATNADGRYAIQGMRAGGPYRVEISYIGFKTEVFSGVVLTLGETRNISTQLKESSEILSEVVVVGRAGIDANKTGAAMAMDAYQIGLMPSISGSVADVIRLNPQIGVSAGGAMFFAGTNNRYNSFQIDGAMNNDVFGLTANGSNGGQAGTQPVSMETIEQLQVSVAPFDVRQSGFTGGAVNAITKSGTNTFHGSVYGFGNNQSLISGKYTMMNGKDSEKYSDQSEYRAGITLGGPIVKNKLFFFANYESANRENPNAYGLGATASRVDAAIAQDLLNEVKQKAADQGITYNGGFGNQDMYTKSDKAGLKLDWNINDRHKASLRWSLVSAKQLNSASSASGLNASDYAYDFVSKTNSFIAELQSRFSDNLSNEFRASYVQVRDERQPDAPFPSITVRSVGDNGGSVNFGNERSSMANRLDQDIWSFTDNLTLYSGDHTFTFGTHNEFSGFANLFIQDAFGTYVYNSPEDFRAGKLAQYRYSQANVAVTGNPRWEATFNTGQLGFYAQDRWNVTDKLDLTLGLRMDIPLFFDTPAENAGFNRYAAEKNWGYKTNSKLSSSPLFSPRIGFRYSIDNDDKYILRGGAGVFTGRIPFVWLSNNFSNTGIQLSTYNIDRVDQLQNLTLILNPNDQSANVNSLTASGSQLINVFSEDFKFAQNMRLNLGLDFELAGINWTAEAIYSKTLNDILYRNLAYGENGETLADAIPGMSFDQRPMFERVTAGTDYSLIYALSNTSKGYTYNLSLKGEKKFDFGLDLMASYAYTQSKSVNSGTSSVAQSNWAYNYTRGNSNDPELGYSAFNFPHRINASAFYHTSYANAWTTTVGLIYTGSSGAPYSIYYYGDINNDSASGNDLIFIPTDGQIDQMPFTPTADASAADQRANMKAWIANDDYMSKHRGEYFERYADNEDFEHHFDLHIAQKYSFNVGNTVHSLELSFDVLNVGNMLNKEWGRYAAAGGSAAYYSPVTYRGGEFQFLQSGDYNMRSYSDYYSRWRGQLGLKYTF